MTKANIALAFSIVAAVGAIGHLAYVAVSPRLTKTPKHVVCFPPAPQLRDGIYQSLFEFETADEVSLGGETADITLANNQRVQMRFGELTCFALPSSPLPAAAGTSGAGHAPAPGFPKVKTDAGPVESTDARPPKK